MSVESFKSRYATRQRQPGIGRALEFCAPKARTPPGMGIETSFEPEILRAWPHGLFGIPFHVDLRRHQFYMASTTPQPGADCESCITCTGRTLEVNGAVDGVRVVNGWRISRLAPRRTCSNQVPTGERVLFFCGFGLSKVWLAFPEAAGAVQSVQSPRPTEADGSTRTEHVAVIVEKMCAGSLRCWVRFYFFLAFLVRRARCGFGLDGGRCASCRPE